MEKQFVPYELALKLKELGFDGECYLKYVAHCLWGTLSAKKVYYQNSKLLKSEVSAPLWQQAFDWFNEQGLEGSVYSTASGYRWCIDKSAHNPKENISGGTSICDSDYEGPNPGGCWENKEEARLALVKRLIQILKESKK